MGAGQFARGLVGGVAGLMLASAALAAEPLEVGNGQAALVTLPRAAAQVIIGDPGVADVSVSSPHQVVVFGKRVGITSLTVLDGGHKAVLDVPVVVRAAAPGGVTVTYGGGKDVKQPGGLSVVFACGPSGCVRAADAGEGGGGSQSAGGKGK